MCYSEGLGRRASSCIAGGWWPPTPHTPTCRAAVVISSKPLDNFPHIRSRNIEEVREAIARVYAKPVLAPAHGVETFNATLNNCRLQFIELAYVGFGAAVELEFPTTQIFSALFPIRGRGEIICGQTSIALTEGAGAAISPDTAHRLNYSSDYEHLVLRINARTLTDKLAAMTGATINEPLRMDSQQSLKQPAARMLQQYVPLLVNTLSGAHPPFPDWWMAQTEQLVMTLFLCGYRHNYSHLLEQDVPDVASGQVRQAEEYIEANAERAVSLEELAEITGVSAFSLFSAFKKCRGYSPHEFLSQVRLRRGMLP